MSRDNEAGVLYSEEAVLDQRLARVTAQVSAPNSGFCIVSCVILSNPTCWQYKDRSYVVLAKEVVVTCRSECCFDGHPEI